MALSDDNLSYNNKYHNIKTRYGLRQAIIVALYLNELNVNEILDKVMKLPLAFDTDGVRISRVIKKLATIGIVEYVYDDLNYRLRLTERGYDEYNNLIK